MPNPVNAAPVVTTSGGVNTVVEAYLVPVFQYLVDPDITITDVDSLSFASATVRISSGLQSGDRLRMALGGGDVTTGDIVSTYSNSTGILTLTSTGGAATLSQWQSAFRQVLYSTNTETPIGGDRIISFALNDGAVSSNVATKTVSLVPVNDSTSLGVGMITTDFGVSEGIQSISTLTNGKTLVAGFSKPTTGFTSVAFARYNLDGSLDTTFGNSGRVVSPFVNGLESNAIFKSTVLPTGKIVAYGYTVNDSHATIPNTQWAVARYNEDGTLDSSFDRDGKLTFDFRGYSSVNGVTLQSDGKLLIMGDYADLNGVLNLGILRLNDNGSPDNSFGANGLALVSFPGYVGSGASKALVMGNGKLLVVGGAYHENASAGGDIALVRLNANGSLDTSFGVAGKSILSTQDAWSREFASDAVLQSDGKFIVVDSVFDPLTRRDSVELVRFNPDGSLDTSFGNAGVLLTQSEKTDLNSNVLTLQPDGKILLGGILHGDFYLARFNGNGTPDLSFGTEGSVTADFGSVADRAMAVSVDTDGKILLAGSGGSPDFALIRFNADGSRDTSFTGAAPLALAGSVVLDAGATIADPELALQSYAGASLTLSRVGGANANDSFMAKLGGSLGALVEGSALVVDGVSMGSVSINHGGNLSLLFGPNASQALVNNVMRQIAYGNGVEAVGTKVNIQWDFSDGNTGAQGPGGATHTVRVASVRVPSPNGGTFFGTSGDDDLTAIPGNDLYQLGAGNDTIRYNATVDSAGVLSWNNGFDTIISTDGGVSGPNYDRIYFNFSADYLAGRKIGNDFEISVYAHPVGDYEYDPGTTDMVGKITLQNAFSTNIADRLSRIDATNGGYFAAIEVPVADSYGRTEIYLSHNGPGDNIAYQDSYKDLNFNTTRDVTVFIDGYAYVRSFDTANTQSWSQMEQYYLAYGTGGQVQYRTRTLWDNGNISDSGSGAPDYLQGAGGNDTLNGGDGNDTLDGLAGDDTLMGGNGNDLLLGGAGREFMIGGVGNDTMDGGAIVDRVSFNDSNQVSYASSTGPVQVDLSGMSGDGSVGFGTANDGMGGTDILINVNIITGSPYADYLKGSSAAVFEQLEGGAGNDTLDGGAINASSNRVTYQNTTGPVTVNLELGQAVAPDGTDTLININNVRGSSAADILIGSNATAYPEIFDGRGGNDTIDGQGGVDQVRFDAATSGVVVNLAAGTAQDGLGGTDTLLNIENVRGTDFADTISGGAGPNVLEGGGGDDSIFGAGGADTLIGGAGNDTFDGGTVTDRINYTDHNVVSYRDAPSSIAVNMQGVSGNGTGGITLVQDGFLGVDRVLNVNIFRGSEYADTFLGSTALWLEQFEGGLGNDSLDGGSITDTLNFENSNRLNYQGAPGAVYVSLADGFAFGAAGKDSFINFNQLRGSEFGDVLTGSDNLDLVETFEGRGGSDTLDGAGGFDQVRYDDAPAAVNVNLQTGRAQDGYGSTDYLFNMEGIRGSLFNDVLTGGNPVNGTGDRDGFEFFRGERGNDTIDGGSGYDRADYNDSTQAVYVVLGGTGVGTAQDGIYLNGVDGPVGTDTLISIEGVRGSLFDDVLTGSNGGGFQSFEGLAGNDTIDGLGGTDRADYRAAHAAVYVDLLGGVAQDGDGGTDSISNIEDVRGSRDFNDTIIGNADDNFLEGLGGNDWLSGGVGKDTLDGGDGDDTLIGGEDNNTLDGGAGTDTVIMAGPRSDYRLEIKLNNRGQGYYEVTHTTGAHERSDVYRAEILQFSDGSTPLEALGVSVKGVDGVDDDFKGSEVADSIEGQSGNETVLGFQGDDTISGGGGQDSLDGGVGGDTLDGGTGDDTLVGGLGADSMVGGSGDDLYYVDDAGDVVVETSNDAPPPGSGIRPPGIDLGGSIDKVVASISYTLGNFVENLALNGGAANVSGTGNALNNVLTGDKGNNVLTGAGGDDTFEFAAFNNGVDRITDFGVGDKILINGVNLVGLARTGNGVAVGLNQVQFLQSGSTTTLYIGSDAEPGADIEIRLDGAFGVQGFRLDGTQIILGNNHAPTGGVTLQGTAVPGGSLTAVSTLQDSDGGVGSLSYQWMLNGIDVPGAVGDSYTVLKADAGKAASVRVSYTDGGGVLESASSNALSVFDGRSVVMTAYSWKAHTLLEGVALSAAGSTAATGPSGALALNGFAEPSLTLTASRAIPAAEQSATSSAVNLQDAIAILKMIVGLPVNGANQPVSPYQILAADYDGNGTVGLNDAIGVLKHVVGLSSPDPIWHFVSDVDSRVAALTGLNPGAPDSTITANVSGSGAIPVGLVGYLSGDVDGSYAGAVGAQDLDVVKPSYLAVLVEQNPGLSLSQFGVYQ